MLYARLNLMIFLIQSFVKNLNKLVIFYRKGEGPKGVLKEVLKDLTENQKKILQSIEKNPKITSEELAEVVGISSRKIRENIRKLKDEGLIRRIGGRKEGYWE